MHAESAFGHTMWPEAFLVRQNDRKRNHQHEITKTQWVSPDRQNHQRMPCSAKTEISGIGIGGLYATSKEFKHLS